MFSHFPANLFVNLVFVRHERAIASSEKMVSNVNDDQTS